MASAIGDILRFLCILLVMNLVFTYEISNGTCPTVTGKPDFDVIKIQGIWHKIKVHNWDDYPCIHDNFTLTSDRRLSIVASYRNGTEEVDYLQLIAKFNPEEPARFFVYYNNDENHLFEVHVSIYADYQGCYVIFSCNVTHARESDGLLHHKAMVVVLCRSPQPTNEEIQPALDAINRQHLSGYKLRDVDQKKCGD